MTLKNRCEWGLLLVVIISIAVNIPYFLLSYYPVHDTLSVFQFFSYYHSQLLYAKELPWWLPFTSYGMPIESYLLFSLGPFQYLALSVGYLFNIKNSLALFSISLIGDTIFFAFGSYLFCRQLFRAQLPALICVISILLLVQYDRQIYWNFKILLPLPLCLYWVQRGILQLNPAYLLMAFATLLVWAFGSISYVLPVQFYVAAFYGLFLILLRLKLRHLNVAEVKKVGEQCMKNLTEPKTCLWAMVATLVICVCAYILYGIRLVMLQQAAYNAIGRHNDLGVGLDDYLSYGGNVGYEKLIELLNGLPTSHPHDFLAYIGLVNVIFVVYGFFSGRKDNSQLALALTVALLLAFTVAFTGVARLAYLLPGMNMVRHIGYFITIAKLLLIILAGFGIRAYLQKIN